MNPLIVNALIFLAGFAFLTAGAEFLVRGSSRLALRMKVPLVVIGLTVVAFGTSLPELLVTIIANAQGGSVAEMAIGNVVGSNIANFALILGIVSLLRPVNVERKLLFQEYPLMLVASLIFFAMAWNSIISRWEGALLFFGLIGFTLYSYTAARDLPAADQAEAVGVSVEELGAEEQPSTLTLLRDLLFIAIGIGGLLLGAHWLVNSATFIARYAGISELVIGLTLVAVGTSLPELATSTVAILRKEGDIAVGNIVGSNLFNILAIVGISSMIRPLPAPLEMRVVDFPFMLLISLLPLLLVLPRPHIMNRWNGTLMLILYIGYNIWLFSGGSLF
jgi:cation:H+ antiporter